MRRTAPSLSAPLKRREEFSLFRVSDDQQKVKISPQLLLATQRFLSRGEGEQRSVSRSTHCPVGQETTPGGHPLLEEVPGAAPVLPLQPCRPRGWSRAEPGFGPGEGGRGPGWARRESPGRRGQVCAGCWPRRHLLPFLVLGQRWTCSAPCASPRRSSCTC